MALGVEGADWSRGLKGSQPCPASEPGEGGGADGGGALRRGVGLGGVSEPWVVQCSRPALIQGQVRLGQAAGQSGGKVHDGLLAELGSQRRQMRGGALRGVSGVLLRQSSRCGAPAAQALVCNTWAIVCWNQDGVGWILSAGTSFPVTAVRRGAGRAAPPSSRCPPARPALACGVAKRATARHDQRALGGVALSNRQ